MKCLSSILLLAVLIGNSRAQDITRISGSASFKVEDDMSWNEAEEKARQMAKINALENAFGVYVEQYTRVDMEEGATHFRMIGETKVKGEWLKTTREKITEEKRLVNGKKGKNKLFAGFLNTGFGNGKERTDIWINCELEGEARLVTHPEIKYEFTPLRCLDAYCQTTDFNPDDPFYLQFRTPVDGYLSIYIVQENDMAYRILPYQTMSEKYSHAVPVEADKDYIFFYADEDHDYFDGFSYLMIDELYMDTEKKEEYMDLYILFSTSEYNKLNIRNEGIRGEEEFMLPGSSIKSRFLEWLGDNRIYDPEFSYKKTILRIK